MMKREIFQKHGIPSGEVQRLEAQPFSASDHVMVEAQPVKRCLDHDLGDRDGTQMDDVGAAFKFASVR